MKTMKTDELLQKLEGIQSVESVMNILNIKRTTAIKLVSMLKKKGYVKTKQTNKKKRIYYISRLNSIGGKSYYDIINNISPIKISESEIYKIYGREPSLEETLVYAIKTKKLRAIMASLALFKYIKDWKLLLGLAKKNKVEREVGALYDLARKIIRTRRMSKRFRQSSLPSKEDKYIYIIEGLKSKDFKKIERLWKVHLPFNKADLEEYQL